MNIKFLQKHFHVKEYAKDQSLTIGVNLAVMVTDPYGPFIRNAREPSYRNFIYNIYSIRSIAHITKIKKIKKNETPATIWVKLTPIIIGVFFHMQNKCTNTINNFYTDDTLSLVTNSG